MRDDAAPIIPELNVPFTFGLRPVAIPPDLRPGWRIAIVLLLIRKCCRQNRTSPTRLHVLSWAVLTKENQGELLRAIEGKMAVDSLLIRVEPSLNRAVDYCRGEGLIKRIDGKRLELTPLGALVADELDDAESKAFVAEREFMNVLGKKVTEDLVGRMFGGELL